MHVVMVKKRLASGETCKKCQEAEAWLVARGLWARVDEVVWCDEADPLAAGWELARVHGVALAPFFIVRTSGGEEVVTSAVALARLLRGAGTEAGVAAGAGAGTAERALDLEEAQRALAGMGPPEVVAWALERWGAACTLAFSGAEDVVLVDMAARSGRPFSVFVLDTGRLHPETLEFVDRVRVHYAIGIDVVAPVGAAIEALVRAKGTMSMRVDGHEECCGIRKVEPLGRALAGKRAWLTGQRPDQSPATRGGLPVIQRDAQRGLWKLNPLAAWTSADVWHWIRAHEVPFNGLHLQGYRSIGCAPCTRPVHPGQHEREGRWWWEDATKRECGLHLAGATGGAGDGSGAGNGPQG